MELPSLQEAAVMGFGLFVMLVIFVLAGLWGIVLPVIGLLYVIGWLA